MTVQAQSAMNMILAATEHLGEIEKAAPLSYADEAHIVAIAHAAVGIVFALLDVADALREDRPKPHQPYRNPADPSVYDEDI
jgi:hypothetical protein